MKHTWPKGQAFPHEPQFSSSLVISMHVPLQKLRPAGHTHFPSMQSFPGEQEFPHAPQFLKSKLVSVQVPLHKVRPARHEHVPLMHAFPRGQTLPHEPQFSSLTLISVQVPLQNISPGRHAELLGTSAMLSVAPQASNIKLDNIRWFKLIFLILIPAYTLTQFLREHYCYLKLIRFIIFYPLRAICIIFLILYLILIEDKRLVIIRTTNVAKIEKTFRRSLMRDSSGKSLPASSNSKRHRSNKAYLHEP